MYKITITIGKHRVTMDEDWNTPDGNYFLEWVQKHYDDEFYYGVEFGDIIVTDSDGRKLIASCWMLEWKEVKS